MVGAHEGYCFSFRTKTLQFWQRNHFYFSSNAREKYVCRWTIKCGKERKKSLRSNKNIHWQNTATHTFSQIWHTKFDMQIHVVISIFAVWRTRNNNRERKKKCSNTQHTIDSFVSCVDRSRRFFDYYYSVSDVTRLAHNKLLLGAPFELRQKILLIKNSIALKNHNTNNGK